MRESRKYSTSGVYHILYRGVNQQNIFEEEKDFLKMKEIISDVKSEMQFEVYAYCFMSNHVHIVMKEKKLKDISLIMKRILTKYARWYNIKYDRSGALIANRYKSVPVEVDEYFIQLIRYIHQNPLRAQLVRDIEEYPYSSYNEYMKKAEITDINFLYEMISKKELKDFHKDIEQLEFRVTDSTKKSDTDIAFLIKKKYDIENPKEISKLEKPKRNEILRELKKECSERQIQRVTGVSRGVISKIK